jgi:hypothetical protein
MSGGPDLNRRPLRPQRVCDPPTRYFPVYSAPGGAFPNPSRAAHGGKMAEATVGRPTYAGSRLSTRTTRPHRARPRQAPPAQIAEARVPGIDVPEDRQGLRGVGQTAIGNKLTPGLTGDALMKVRRRPWAALRSANVVVVGAGSSHLVAVRARARRRRRRGARGRGRCRAVSSGEASRDGEDRGHQRGHHRAE